MWETAIGLLFRAIGWSTEDIRVANAFDRAARREGLRVNRKELRRALNDADFVSGLEGDPGHGTALRSALSAILSPPPEPDALSRLVDSLRDARLERLRGGSNALTMTERLDRGRHDDLVQRMETSDAAAALFEPHLAMLLPSRASAFRTIHAEFPRVAQLLADVLNASSGRARIREWAADHPLALTAAPVDTFGALADLANDFDERQAATQFIEAGLTRGLTPRAYWAVRRADLRITNDTTEAEVRGWLADHLEYPLTKAMLGGNDLDAIGLLESWVPDSPAEDEHRRLLLCQHYVRARRFDDLIRLADESYSIHQSRQAAIMAIQGRVTRYELSSGNRTGEDLESALTLAQRARADRERLQLSNDKELTWELRVRRLLYDIQGALSLTADLASNPAFVEVLRTATVAGEVAMLYAAAGDLDLARQYASRTSGIARARVDAMLAEREEDEPTAIALWNRVADESDNWNDRATAALRLAFHGVESPFLVELRTANPDIAAEVTLAAALFGGQPDAVARARQMASTSRAAVDFLLMYHERNGELDQAYTLAGDASRRTGNPDLWLETARLARRLGENEAALEAAKEAVTRSTARWGQRKRAFQLMVELSSAQGDWQGARDAAQRLLALEPDDPSASWALTYCLIRLNQIELALTTWRQHGRPDPYDSMSIDAWTTLVREFGDQVGSAVDALRFAAQFPTDQHIRDRLIGAFLLRRRPASFGATDTTDEDDADPAPADAAAFQELLANHIRDFPDGPIRMITIDTDDLLASISREVGEGPDTSEVDELAARGQVPIAMVAEVHNREVAAVVTRLGAFGPVFSGPSTEAGEAVAATYAEGQVVLDVTAASTLTQLPEPLRVSLMGYFGSIVTTLGVQADAHENQLAAERDSGLSIVPPRDGVPVQVSRTESADLADHLAFASGLEAVLMSVAGLQYTGGPAIPELSEVEWRRPGFEPLGLAGTTGRALWADDRALVEVARAAGVPAFTTPDVLACLATRGVVSADELQTATASLVAHGHVGTPYSAAVWEMAVDLDPRRRGVLNAALHATGDEVQARVQWLLRLTDVASDDSLLLRDTVAVAAEWLQKIAGTEEQASINMVQLSRLLLSRDWMTSSTLPWCVIALRSSRLRVDASTSLLHEVFRSFEALSEYANPEHAAQFLFELVSQLEQEDASRVRAAILRGRFE